MKSFVLVLLSVTVLRCMFLCRPLEEKIIFGDCFCKKDEIYVLPEFKNKPLPKSERWAERKSRKE